MSKFYDVYLTTREDDEEPLPLVRVERQEDARSLCTTLQPYLRDGFEVRFVAADEEEAG
jgi:hypothetical protein